MEIYIKTKDGEYKFFDSSQGDSILLNGSEDELNIIEPSAKNKIYIYIPEDSPDDTGENLVHYLLNGTPPDESLQNLRESMGMNE